MIRKELSRFVVGGHEKGRRAGRRGFDCVEQLFVRDASEQRVIEWYIILMN